MFGFFKKKKAIQEEMADILIDAIKKLAVDMDDENNHEKRYLYELELLPLFIQIMDLTLFVKLPEKRLIFIKEVRKKINEKFDIIKGNNVSYLSIDDFLDTRANLYGAVVRNEFEPVGSWFLGERSKDTFFKVLLLFGDYYEYCYISNKLADDDDVKAVFLVNVFKVIDISIIIISLISPVLKEYQQLVVKVISGK